MKELLTLFITFLKMGVVNFGGGYAMLPLLEREIVEKHKWATMEEIQDYFAIGQCTPGVIAVNVSTFIGFKRKGVLGGIVATLGFVFCPIIIILLIATVLRHFNDYKAVQYAFAAIRVCVIVLILSAVIKIIKKSLVDIYTIILFLIILGLSIFTDLSSIIFVLGAGVLGVTINLIRDLYNSKKIIKEKAESNVEDNNELDNNSNKEDIE